LYADELGESGVEPLDLELCMIMSMNEVYAQLVRVDQTGPQVTVEDMKAKIQTTNMLEMMRQNLKEIEEKK
jgi:hypothetical protein